jgi:CubicO group peptidase (beta-lactamase class C family)
MRLSSVLALILIPAVGAPATSQDPIQSLDEEMELLVPLALDELSVPGAAVALLREGRVVYTRGFGWADRSTRRRVGAGTQFSVGSISKTVAAWGVMRLVETGKLALDEPVDSHITRWRLPFSDHNPREVTVRRLLSHTAGLSLHGYPGWPPNQPLPTLEESLSGRTNGAGDVRLILPPGRVWRYSGGGYTLLQMALEEVSGEDFARYMRREILSPLGMKNSGFVPVETPEGASKAHDGSGNEIPSHRFTEQAAAGFQTTITDLALFAAAALRGPDGSSPGRGVLKPETVRMMMEAAPATDGAYGLGYSIQRRENGPPLRGHTGANVGWHALLQIIPETGDGLVVATNGDNGWAVYRLVLARWLEWLDAAGSPNRTAPE